MCVFSFLYLNQPVAGLQLKPRVDTTAASKRVQRDTVLVQAPAETQPNGIAETIQWLSDADRVKPCDKIWKTPSDFDDALEHFREVLANKKKPVSEPSVEVQ